MNRSLVVDVRENTWPGSGKLPDFPSTFHSGVETHQVNIPSTLLLIGYLTTPTSSTGVSLSEFWAWVRYLAAVTNDNDLRLTQSFADLDAHQKTILSDDFGMGVPMHWLSQRLTFSHIVDGRYFMQRVAASLGASQRRTAKRGPNKTPDFVARDTNGIWHVVECKGTQSGRKYGEAQLGDSGPPPSGGIAQKRSIEFPPGHSGQRLVCGLCIGMENGEPSRLTVVDPKVEEPFRLGSSQLELAEDAAARGVASRALRLSGFETTAAATAAPLGAHPGVTRSRAQRAEAERQEYVNERDQRARTELDQAELHSDGSFQIREVNFTLPRPVRISDREVGRVMIRQSINRDFLARLREQPTVPDPNYGNFIEMPLNEMKNTAKSDEHSATFYIGELFRSELILD
ncbi:hypothetical protein [uncultured Maricaulis sp.]|uniref:hypothetical protein n=1 Tax=uncultured Maricaulis sp. TaxID=174710 RepID=UPI0026022FEC|nr:hypothetical protein [uncultured Maricaulis sp.]